MVGNIREGLLSFIEFLSRLGLCLGKISLIIPVNCSQLFPCI